MCQVVLHPGCELRTGHAKPHERRLIRAVCVVTVVTVQGGHGEISITQFRDGGRDGSGVVIATALGGAIPTVHVDQHGPLGPVVGSQCLYVHPPITTVCYCLGHQD